MTDKRWDFSHIEEKMPDIVKGKGSSAGFEWIKVLPGDLLRICRSLKEAGYDLLVDISSVDMSVKGITPRFTVIYNLFSLNKKTRLIIKTDIAENEAAPSVTQIWQGADWMEREVYDLMGVNFSGHPNLERILTYEGIPGHPLRKDFPLRARNVPWVRPE